MDAVLAEAGGGARAGRPRHLLRAGGLVAVLAAAAGRASAAGAAPPESRSSQVWRRRGRGAAGRRAGRPPPPPSPCPPCWSGGWSTHSCLYFGILVPLVSQCRSPRGSPACEP